MASWTLLPSRSSARTPTSVTGKPSRRARARTSASNANPSSRARLKTSSAACRWKPFRPHWVSRNGRPSTARMAWLKPRPGRHDLPPTTSVGTGRTSREARDVLSYRYATSPHSSHSGYSTTKVPAQQSYERSDGALTLRIPFHHGCGRLQRLQTATHQRLRWSEPVWSPPPESNRRPHPYHGTTRNRCANRGFPRSRSTVGAKVMGSLQAQLCARLQPCSA
jgi:hypothetical protein